MITYKPMRNKCIVAVDTSQKEDYLLDLGGGAKIWMRQNYGFDNRTKAPVLARVVSTPSGVNYLESGDFVACHHISFNRAVVAGSDYMYGSLGVKDENGWELFSLELPMIWFKVNMDGSVASMPGFLTVERLTKKVDTALIVPDIAVKTEDYLFRVSEVGPDCSLVNPQDLILCLKHSDLEVNFTWNLAQHTVYRVKYDDVVAIYPKNCAAYESVMQNQ